MPAISHGLNRAVVCDADGTGTVASANLRTVELVAAAAAATTGGGAGSGGGAPTIDGSGAAVAAVARAPRSGLEPSSSGENMAPPFSIRLTGT